MPMNPEQGPFEFLASLAAEPFHPKYRKPPRMPEPPKPPLTPAQKTLRRALAGAFFVAACLWLSPVMFGVYLPALWQSHNPPIGVWLPVAVYAFAALAGLWALFVGLRETRANVPPSLMGSFWAASVLVGIGVLWVKIVPPAAFAAYLAHGFLITAAAVLAVYFWIASGLQQARARWIINRQLNRRNAPFIAAGARRRFFFFW